MVRVIVGVLSCLSDASTVEPIDVQNTLEYRLEVVDVRGASTTDHSLVHFDNEVYHFDVVRHEQTVLVMSCLIKQFAKCLVGVL